MSAEERDVRERIRAEMVYATEPGYAPVNVVLDNDEKEARAEAALHADDPPDDPIHWHPVGCRCPDHGDWPGTS